MISIVLENNIIVNNGGLKNINNYYGLPKRCNLFVSRNSHVT